MKWCKAYAWPRTTHTVNLADYEANIFGKRLIILKTKKNVNKTKQ